MKTLSTLAVALIVCCASSAQAADENPLKAFVGTWRIQGENEVVDTAEIFIDKKKNLIASVTTKRDGTIGAKGVRMVASKHRNTVQSINEFRFGKKNYQFVFTMSGETEAYDLGSFTVIARDDDEVTVTVDRVTRVKTE